MIKQFALSACTATFLLASAAAAPVVIDDFDTTVFQVVGAPTLVNPAANPATDTLVTSDAIGGMRTLSATRTNPPGTDNPFGQQVQARVTGGAAEVSIASSVEGFAVFSWSAGGADLVDGTNTVVDLSILTVDLPGTVFSLTFDGVTSTQVDDGSGSLRWNFADFAGVDFSNIDSIALSVMGASGLDVRFDTLVASSVRGTPGSEVPLPAAGLLFVLTLGGLVSTRRR